MRHEIVVELRLLLRKAHQLGIKGSELAELLVDVLRVEETSVEDDIEFYFHIHEKLKPQFIVANHLRAQQHLAEVVHTDRHVQYHGSPINCNEPDR